MQPQDPYSPPTPPAPDLPDAALPAIEPVQEYQPPAQPQMPPVPPVPPTEQTPLLPQAPEQNQTAPENDQGRHHLSSVGKKFFQLVEFDDKEILLAEIRKHPFGLFIILFGGFLIATTLFIVIAFFASTSFLESVGLGNTNAVVVFIGFLLSLLVIVVTAVNAHLYRNNVVFVTNEKIAQVLFITLFNRKLSQLSIGDVQDVTVQQNGFIPNLVGYGTLVVETAGEQQNYTFTFVPHPYETSKIIINAHEQNLQKFGN